MPIINVSENPVAISPDNIEINIAIAKNPIKKLSRVFKILESDVSAE